MAMGDLFTEKSGDGRIHPQRSSESLPLPLPLPLPRNTFTWNDGNGIQKKKKTRLLPLKDCHYVELVTSSNTGTLFTSTTKSTTTPHQRLPYPLHHPSSA